MPKPKQSAHSSTVGGDAKVKVAVRVRPLSKKERKMDSTPCIQIQDTQVIMESQKGEAPKIFNFDHSFWSANEQDEHYACQAHVFDALGHEVLDSAFEGYNACIFAYGQTGSGKTYTMMGTEQTEAGIIPRLCNQIFERINSSDNPHLTFKVDVSYMEIYNEKVQDLLSPSQKGNLRLREHKILGPYVEGLSKLAVSSFTHIKSLMDQGNKLRHTAETEMNEKSSRSHAVFTITVTQAHYFEATKTTGEKVSRISLVDLAGSERHGKTGTSGQRLVEGSNINKSLTTLGLVISALADNSSGKNKFIPYRDSTLTWLLKDNLGGNSRTVMVATVSPAWFNYEESLSTLRYADRAKRIVNHAIVNEDPNARVIRELQEELERLRQEVGGGGKIDSQELEETRLKLRETEALIEELNMSWEEKLKATEHVLEERKKMLDEHAASIETKGNHALRLESRLPHFISLSDDPLSSNITIYTFKEGITRIGRDQSSSDDERDEEEGEEEADVPAQDIHIFGLGTEPEHAIIEFKVEHDATLKSLVEVVILHPIAEECYVDGEKLEDSIRLRQGHVVQLGQTNLFRFNHPTEAARLRKQLKNKGDSSSSLSGNGASKGPLSFKTASALLGILNPNSKEEEERKAREAKEKEELARQKESLENERALLRAEMERMAREREELENQRQEQLRQQAAHEEQLRREAQLLEEKRQKELEREIRDRAEREAREEMAKQQAETEALRLKVEEMQRQLQAGVRQKELELQRRIELERQQLLAESKATQQEIEDRARQEAALALEEERRRQDDELAKARDEIQRLAQAQEEENAKRRQEAEQRLAEATREIGQKNDLVRQLKEQLEMMQAQREAEAAEAEAQLHAELRAKEEEQSKLLEEAQQHEQELLQQIAEREASVREDIRKQAEADQEKNAMLERLQQESIAREEASKKEAQRKLEEMAARLERERAEFERERRLRQEAEALAAREKWERDLEEAYNMKILEEERQETEKKFKRNMQAKEAWMSLLQGRQAVEAKLKEETALLADATSRRNEAAKDLAKADIKMQQSKRQSLLLERDIQLVEQVSKELAHTNINNNTPTSKQGLAPVAEVVDNETKQVGGNLEVGARAEASSDDSSGDEDTDDDEDVIDITTPSTPGTRSRTQQQQQQQKKSQTSNHPLSLGESQGSASKTTSSGGKRRVPFLGGGSRSLQKEADDLKQQLSLAEQNEQRHVLEKAMLEEKLQSLREEHQQQIAKLQDQVEELTSTSGSSRTLLAEKEELETQNSRLHSMLDLMQKDARAHRDEISLLRDRVEDLSTEIRGLRAWKTALTNEVLRLDPKAVTRAAVSIADSMGD
eukprot:m.215114 g.215114  ORF g.215114 m.215114 type:complete len:1342 (-) comp16972_c4_seq1:3575-7600(-)